MGQRNRPTFHFDYHDNENLIINGGFEISQRVNMVDTSGGGYTLTAASKPYWVSDRWIADVTATSSDAYAAVYVTPRLPAGPGSNPTLRNRSNYLYFANTYGRIALSQAIEGADVLLNNLQVGWSFLGNFNIAETAFSTWEVSFVRQYRSSGVQTETLTAIQFVVPSLSKWQLIGGTIRLDDTGLSSDGWNPTGNDYLSNGSDGEGFTLMKLRLVSPELSGSSSEIAFTGFRINAGEPRSYFPRPFDEEWRLCERFFEATWDSEQHQDTPLTSGATFIKAGNHNTGGLLDYYHRYRTRKRRHIEEHAIHQVSAIGNSTGHSIRNLSKGNDVSATAVGRWSGETGCRIESDVSITSASVYGFQIWCDAEYSLTSVALAK